MTKGFLQIIVAATAVALLTGCSIKGSSESGDGLKPNGSGVNAESFDNLIQGPVVEGTWASTCLYDAGLSKYKIKSAVFTGQKINRTELTFSDATCTQLSKRQEYNGLYRWSDITSYGGYAVDYRFDLGNGITSITKEEILIEKNIMYLSDFYNGFGMMSKEFPMQKQGDLAPAPTPNPQPGPNPNPNPQKCANFRGTFYAEGYYTAIDQNECNELIWQPLDNASNPLGSPDVYLMDGVEHQMGSDLVISYYKDA